jgi:hypothetical protein
MLHNNTGRAEVFYSFLFHGYNTKLLHLGIYLRYRDVSQTTLHIMYELLLVLSQQLQTWRQYETFGFH